MPRLSLYSQNKQNDYRFIDRIVRESYTVGGLDIFIHKYLGVKPTADDGTPGDATQPHYDETNPLFIEDLLLLENRNRDYDEDIYTLRGEYRVQDLDFDLSQFGLFIQGDTLYLTFHYNDMIDHIGRKLMNGDVLEIPNLKDYHPLDNTVPALPKFYVIDDTSFASEGFSSTWLPHIWRVKAIPMVGSQEYKDILDDYTNNTGGIDGDDGEGNGEGTLADYMCTHQKNLEINDAIIAQAEHEVPLSGYDITKFYLVNASEEDNNAVYITGDSTDITADNNLLTVDMALISPDISGYEMSYMTGDGLPPNGLPVTPGVAFPPNAVNGDYCLRLDYVPNRLFRYNGSYWNKMEDSVRTPLTNGADCKTQRSNFVNNTKTVETTDRGDIPSRQSLSKILKPQEDN